MPELREVFDMVTKQTEPDLDAWREQERRQRRASRNRRVGAFAAAAAIALAGVIAFVVTRGGVDSSEQVPLAPSPTTAPRATAPVGTVTFDGSTCSMEITADRIESGVVLFEAVNTAEQRVMLDSWRLLDGYAFRAFEATVERGRRLAENRRWQADFDWPGETEVTYLGSDVIPANSSEVIASTMPSGRHAITCLRLAEDSPEGRFHPWGIAGPFIVR